MRPYDGNFIKEKLEEYNKIINEIKIKNYEIKKRISNSKNDIGYLYEKDNNIEEECIDLIKSNNVYMTLSSRD